jgi:hypothetical protein
MELDESDPKVFVIYFIIFQGFIHKMPINSSESFALFEVELPAAL